MVSTSNTFDDDHVITMDGQEFNEVVVTTNAFVVWTTEVIFA